MNIKNVLKTVGNFVVKNGHWFLTGLGVAGITVGAIDLAKTVQSDKFKKTIETSKNIILDIDRDEDGKATTKELVTSYAKSAAYKIKAYARPVAILAGGTGCVVAAVFVQSRRVKQLVALYTTTVAAYEAYRNRVREAVGEEKERDLYYDIKRDENGNVVSVNGKESDKMLGYKGSEATDKFSRLIGQGFSSLWCVRGYDLYINLRNAEECVRGLFLQRAAESSDNTGIVYMNEIYELFGLPKTNEGMFYAYRYTITDPDTNPNFRIVEEQLGEDGVAILKNGWKQELWLDFKPNYYNEKPFKDEIPRTEADKQRIISNRRKGLTNTTEFDSIDLRRAGKNDCEEVDLL